MQVPFPITSARSVHYFKEISASSLKIPHVQVHHINSEGKTEQTKKFWHLERWLLVISHSLQRNPLSFSTLCSFKMVWCLFYLFIYLLNLHCSQARERSDESDIG